MPAPTITSEQLPTGTWEIDPVHSSAEFSARHMVVAKVKGHFTKLSGTITVAADPMQSSVEATIDAASVDTRDERRDGHLRSPDFLDVANYPAITFASTGAEAGSDGHLLHGDLTIHGVTRPVRLDLEHNGTGPDPYGGTRTGFTATTEINRRDFDLNFNGIIEGTGGALVGDKVTITIEVEAVLKPS